MIMNGYGNSVFDPFEGGTEDRLRALEQRVEMQEDEITLLKSSLSNVLRRLKEFESSGHGVRKPIPLKNTSMFTPLPSRPSMEAASPKSRPRPPSPGFRKQRTPSRDDNKSNGFSSGNDLRRTGSVDHLNRSENKRASFRGRKQSGNFKQTTYSDQDGSVRMHLRGRPVVLYKPTDNNYNISAPSQLPDSKLKLEWVYGYRGRDCRSNLYHLPTGEIVYFVAAVVVLYDPKDGYQRHYLGHNDDIKCLAIHPDKLKIATGQLAGLDMDGRPRLPQIHVWDAVSLTTLHVLTSFERSVGSLSFSKTDGGVLLCATDESNDHVLSVWNWQKETKIVEAKSSKDLVLLSDFHPYVEGCIVTCGKNHVNFWTFDGNQLTKKQGFFEKHEKARYILCLGFLPGGEILSGDSNGNIQVWTKAAVRKITHVIQGAHTGPVFCIHAIKDGSFITGGKDGIIKQWNSEFQAVQQTQIPENTGSVRTLSLSDQQMLVGTKNNCILQGDFKSSFETVVHGHVEELWGLAVHHSNPHFLTGSYDKQLIMWDCTTHLPLWTKTFDDEIQSADFHPSCDVIAVAMTTGRWLVLDVNSLELVTVHTDGNEQHDVIKFSPDGSYLAIGSHDNCVYVYQVSEDGRKYTKQGKCTGHSSYITHLDWSVDSKCLQTNSGDYELLYWDAHTCKQQTGAASLRDIEWKTQTCTLGFSVLGIWPEGADGTDINSVDRSNDGKLLVSGDDFGKVHLFKYPASQPRSVSHCANGHSSHVTSVKFLHNDERVLSVGGQDCSAMQWKVV